MLVTHLKRSISRKSLGIFVVVFLFAFLALTGVSAQETPIQNGFDRASNIGGSDIGTADLRDVIVNIVNIALGFLGIIAIVILIYGGFLWMTSAGNEQQVERARRTLINSAIGLGIILLSWAIATFVINSLLLSTNEGPGGSTGPGGPGRGALGNGIVQNVYPPPGARDIPRNTHIFVTFKEPMNVSSIIDGAGFIEGCGGIGTANVEIIDERDGTGIDDGGCVTRVSVTPDGRTFDFNPGGLGSDTSPVNYTVRLKGGIEKADGSDAFTSLSATGIGFDWQFQVSTFFDGTPPYVVNYRPRADSDNPRNVIISLTFNEVINPISINPGGSDSIVVDASGVPVTGTVFLAGDYRNVDFFPDSECEGNPLNTCGEPIFCLPANETIRTLVMTDAESTPAMDGIQDAAGNKFDGNRNGTGGEVLPVGPVNIGVTPLDETTGDSAFWTFTTNDTIDIIPPLVIERLPDTGSTGVDHTDPLSIKMDKQLTMSTVKPNGSYGDGKEYVTLVDPTRRTGYWITGTNGNGCSAQCLNQGSDSVFESVCGNGIPEAGEDCDDGNTRSRDGCSNVCLNEGTATCGDGIVSHAEECDINAEPWLSNPGTCEPGSCLLLGSDSCSGAASSPPCCGNGVIELGEVCDGTEDPGCHVPPFGSGANPGTPTTGFCLRIGSPTCGDGTIDPEDGEACDDGNIVDGDGCSSICLREGAFCGDGDIDPGEDCDGGPGCAFDCTHEGNPTGSCGDSVQVSAQGEDCDLGPLSNEAYIFVNHTPFEPETNYGVRLGSGVRDAFQNCFLPCADHDQGSPIGGGRCARVPNAGSEIGWAEGVPWSALAAFPICELP